MRMYDLIKKKRDGEELTTEEIQFFVGGFVDGTVPDYQVSALLMAIYYKGMSSRETKDLTFAVRDSGVTLDLSKVNGIRVDKHSTGGVGDKTSLVVAPIVASLGVKVAKMSGRGLGHTGGTIDKLESIDGFRTDISEEEFVKIVNDIGICIVGQSQELAPADKKLYALRDVTATVDSLPLIVSSIMGKKLAADDDCIVLDVKTGSGAFAKTVADSTALAEAMVDIGKAAGKKMLALITDMDRPLGNAIGNALEVREAIETLDGKGPEDFTELCMILSAYMLHLADMGSFEECRGLAQMAVDSGRAKETFREMVRAQHGDPGCVDDVSKLKTAPFTCDICATTSGYVSRIDTEGYGVASLMLGAGRNTKEDTIDYGAGIMLKKKTGDYVNVGDVLAVMYASREELFPEARVKLLDSTEFSNTKPEERPLVLATVK